MDTSTVTFTITDLRHKTSKVLKEAKKRGYAFLIRHSKPEAALVDIKYLKALEEAYEDHLDILEIEEAKKEKGKILFSEYLKRHKNR